jgi:hypothetical protein
MNDVTGEVAHRLGLGHGFFGDLLVDLLAFTIDGVELRGIAETSTEESTPPGSMPLTAMRARRP